MKSQPLNIPRPGVGDEIEVRPVADYRSSTGKHIGESLAQEGRWAEIVGIESNGSLHIETGEGALYSNVDPAHVAWPDD